MKVFISHSSLDKDVVTSFKQQILILGLGIQDEDITYTSLPENGTPPGCDIKTYIHDNILNSAVVLLMISNNYKNSEICLNEMGAAWASEAIVVPILLINTDFNSLGFLYKTTSAIKINDGEMLDEFKDRMEEALKFLTKTAKWNRAKNEYLSTIANRNSSKKETHIENVELTDEKGILDYRELFVQNISLTKGEVKKVSDFLIRDCCVIENIANQLTMCTPNARDSVGHFKQLMKDHANQMNEQSSVFENATIIKTYFFRAVDAAVMFFSALSNYDAAPDNYRKTFINLLEALSRTKRSLNELKKGIDGLPEMERNQISAKKRLSKSVDDLEKVYSDCIERGSRLLTI